MKREISLLKHSGEIIGEGKRMSRPRNDWYGSVKGFIMRYYAKGERSTEIKEKIIDNCNIVLRETEQMEQGRDRIKAIDKILLSKTHTIDGVAIEQNYSRRTVQRWISDFICEVGRRSGF